MSQFSIPIPFTTQNGTKMYKRHEYWRLGYRVQRYMSHLSFSELDQRNQDIFANLTVLTASGQISLPPLKGDHPFPWMEMWTHVMEEYGLRGTGMREGFIQDAPMPIIPKDGRVKGTIELQKKGLDATGKLVKFGKKDHILSMFKTGKWRIAPASSYENDKCRARQDSELRLSYRVPEFRRHPMASDILDECFPDTLERLWDFKSCADGDYYLASFARTLVPRLFEDFESDACLIVMDERLFLQKMLNAFREFRPRWPGQCRRVDYVDPILPIGHPNVMFAKHFRYAYQDEFRFVWHPIEPIERLNPVFVELGPLCDCCELLICE